MCLQEMLKIQQGCSSLTCHCLRIGNHKAHQTFVIFFGKSGVYRYENSACFSKPIVTQQRLAPPVHPSHTFAWPPCRYQSRYEPKNFGATHFSPSAKRMSRNQLPGVVGMKMFECSPFMAYCSVLLLPYVNQPKALVINENCHVRTK
jgi:hypothetical protein